MGLQAMTDPDSHTEIGYIFQRVELAMKMQKLREWTLARVTVSSLSMEY